MDLNKIKYRVYIPSRERSRLVSENKGTFYYINGQDVDYSLVVRESEVKDYVDAGFKGAILKVPDNSHIADKNQDMLEECQKDGIEYLIRFDDDLSFYYRDEAIASKYKSDAPVFRERYFKEMLTDLFDICSEKYPLVGVTNKFMSQEIKKMYIKNSFVFRVSCLHVPTITKENIRLNGYGGGHCEDRFIFLTLLHKGYTTILCSKYCHHEAAIGDYIGRGGCFSVDRVKVQNESATAIHNLFPEDTKLVSKTTKFWPEERLDVIVYVNKRFNTDGKTYVPSDEMHKFILNNRRAHGME